MGIQASELLIFNCIYFKHAYVTTHCKRPVYLKSKQKYYFDLSGLYSITIIDFLHISYRNTVIGFGETMNHFATSGFALLEVFLKIGKVMNA